MPQSSYKSLDRKCKDFVLRKTGVENVKKVTQEYEKLDWKKPEFLNQLNDEEINQDLRDLHFLEQNFLADKSLNDFIKDKKGIYSQEEK